MSANFCNAKIKNLNIDGVLIFISLFFTVGLNEVDKFGYIGFGSTNETIMLRVIWFSILFIILFIISMRKTLQDIPLRGLNYFLLYELVVFISLVLNASDIKGVYYYLELASMGVLWLMLVNSRHQNIYLIDVVQCSIFYNYLFLLFILCLFLIFKLDMVYQLESQERFRLGGDVVSPNALAVFSAIFILSMKYLYKRGKITIFVYIFCFFLSGIVVLASGSRSGIGLFLLASLLSLYHFTKLRLFLLTFIVFVPILLVIFFAGAEFVGKGDDPLREVSTLNNRTVVFQVAIEGISNNWLYGVGYVTGVKDYFFENFTQKFWLPPHSHNAYLEILLAFGVPIGLMVFIALFKVLWWLIGRRDAYYIMGNQALILMLYGIVAVPFGGKIWPGFVLLVLFGSIYYRHTHVKYSLLVNKVL